MFQISQTSNLKGNNPRDKCLPKVMLWEVIHLIKREWIASGDYTFYWIVCSKEREESCQINAEEWSIMQVTKPLSIQKTDIVQNKWRRSCVGETTPILFRWISSVHRKRVYSGKRKGKERKRSYWSVRNRRTTIPSMYTPTSHSLQNLVPILPCRSFKLSMRELSWTCCPFRCKWGVSNSRATVVYSFME